MVRGFGTELRRRHTTEIRRALTAIGCATATVESNPIRNDETRVLGVDESIEDQVVRALEDLANVSAVTFTERGGVRELQVLWNV